MSQASGFCSPFQGNFLISISQKRLYRNGRTSSSDAGPPRLKKTIPIFSFFDIRMDLTTKTQRTQRIFVLFVSLWFLSVRITLHRFDESFYSFGRRGRQDAMTQIHDETGIFAVLINRLPHE